jgi:hypothetical protein
VTKNLQTTSNILMVRPANFGYNEQTAENNAFQTLDPSLDHQQISKKAIEEFDLFVDKLRKAGVHVIVAQDSAEPVKPDAIFPNNWVTFHNDGTIITYPMYAPVRRFERNEAIIDQISKRFEIKKRKHLEHFEDSNRYLEGTGSMILDRANKIVYACLSPRTDDHLLDEFCDLTDYRKMVFHATDEKGTAIYHTNVMMALGESFVIICLETIKNESELKELLACFAETKKEVIAISMDQMLAFAGNMLQLRTNKDETLLVMSEQAYRSLQSDQITTIKSHTNILYSPINTIETYGGGSTRCMMAEVFLPPRHN